MAGPRSHLFDGGERKDPEWIDRAVDLCCEGLASPRRLNERPVSSGPPKDANGNLHGKVVVA